MALISTPTFNPAVPPNPNAVNQQLTNANLGQNAGTINSIVSDVAAQEAAAKENAANAKAQQIMSQGATAQATSYGTAAQIAKSNAQLQGISGQIQQTQALRAAFHTIGEQRAAVGASGLANAGSALSLLRSSTQQAYLNAQVIGVNSNMAQAGFLEQAVASGGEQSAATAAANAQTALSQAEAQAGQLAQANATAEAAALGQVFPGTPAASLATGISTGAPINTQSYASLLAAQTGGGPRSLQTGLPLPPSPWTFGPNGQPQITRPPPPGRSP